MRKIVLFSTLMLIAVSSTASASRLGFQDDYNNFQRSGFKPTPIEEMPVYFYDQYGIKEGSAKKNTNGGYDYYDQYGRKTGSSRR